MQHAQDIDIDIDAIRPWRRATIAVSAVAAVELVALAAVAIVLLGNPIAKHLRETTAAAAGPPRVRTAQPAPAKKAALSRGDTSVMVLNGGGQAGAAHSAADRVSARGYQLGQIGNAAGMPGRAERGRDDIAHVHVVARLRPVPEDHRRLALAQPVHEDRDDTRFALRILSRPVHVPVAQRDVLGPVQPVVRSDVLLAGEL